MASPQNGNQYPARNAEEVGNPLIDVLTGPTRWGEVRGAAISLTYSFPWTTNPTATWATNGSYSGLNEPPLGFALGPNQQAAVRLALATWSSVANIGFTEVAETATNVGDLRFANTTRDNGGFAWAYFPSGFGAAGGDVWIAQTAPGPTVDALDTWRQGNYGFSALVHEVGHALGLSHPGDNPTDPAYTQQTTVMSYNDWPGALYYGRFGPGGDGVQYRYSYINPTGPSVNDIAAIQSLYGANLSYRAGNDTYTFSTTLPFFQTLWDGGGTDEISVANFRTGCVIDLTPGSYSSISVVSEPFPPFTSGTPPTYLGQNNLGIALGCLIENATGGSGADTLRGNAANNVLRGGAGDDVLSGGGGADTFVFAASGDGADTVLDFTAGDRLLVLAALAATTVQAGTGASVAGRSVQLTTGDAGSTLWIDTDGLAGAEARIALNGRWTTQDLRLLLNGDGSTSVLRNTAPVAAAAAAGQVVNARSALLMPLRSDVFADADIGDTLSLSLQRSGGQPLPAWLSFNAATRTLTGTPQPGDVGVLDLRLSAQDAAGASASQAFRLVVVPQGFAALSYTASYADLRAAFGTDAVAAASHYLQAGQAEGRSVSFDPLRYLASNPDLISFFGLDTASATRHYITNGYAENRQASFDALRYIASNPDLIAYFGLNPTAATTHYIANGFAEGRRLNFDALRYVASNPDLIAAFGLNTTAATTHYIANGYAEGRSTTRFDPAVYLGNYADLRNAFGNDLTAATQHYINAGAAEGRVITPLVAGPPAIEPGPSSIVFDHAAAGALDGSVASATGDTDGNPVADGSSAVHGHGSDAAPAATPSETASVTLEGAGLSLNFSGVTAAMAIGHQGAAMPGSSPRREGSEPIDSTNASSSSSTLTIGLRDVIDLSSVDIVNHPAGRADGDHPLAIGRINAEYIERPQPIVIAADAGDMVPPDSGWTLAGTASHGQTDGNHPNGLARWLIDHLATVVPPVLP